MVGKKSLLIIFFFTWLCKPLIAQDEDALPAADYEADAVTKGNPNEMR